MIDKAPRIALETLRIQPGQKLRRLFWRWGPVYDLPDGRAGAWAVNDIQNVAVRCEFDADAPERDPAAGLWAALDWCAAAEERQSRDAYLTGITDREAATIKRQQTRRAKKAAPLAAAVEAQLEDILRTA